SIPSIRFILSPLTRSPLPTLFPYTTLFRSYSHDIRRHMPIVALCQRRKRIPRRTSGSDSVAGCKTKNRHAASPGSSIHNRSKARSEEHTSELQSRGHLVCRLLLEKKNL